MACHLAAITYPSICWFEFSFCDFWNVSWKFHDLESTCFLLIYFLASFKLRNFLHQRINMTSKSKYILSFDFPGVSGSSGIVFGTWSRCLTWLPSVLTPISIGGAQRSLTCFQLTGGSYVPFSLWPQAESQQPSWIVLPLPLMHSQLSLPDWWMWVGDALPQPEEKQDVSSSV